MLVTVLIYIANLQCKLTSRKLTTRKLRPLRKLTLRKLTSPKFGEIILQGHLLQGPEETPAEAEVPEVGVTTLKCLK